MTVTNVIERERERERETASLHAGTESSCAGEEGREERVEGAERE
jgi:hypothetical protein